MRYKKSIYDTLGKSFSSAILNSVQFKAAIRGVSMKQKMRFFQIPFSKLE